MVVRAEQASPLQADCSIAQGGTLGGAGDDADVTRHDSYFRAAGHRAIASGSARRVARSAAMRRATVRSRRDVHVIAYWSRTADGSSPIVIVRFTHVAGATIHAPEGDNTAPASSRARSPTVMVFDAYMRSRYRRRSAHVRGTSSSRPASAIATGNASAQYSSFSAVV